MSDCVESTKPIYRDINADDDEPEITEMESMCMQCEKNGSTRIFLTKIPFFKEVIIMSFSCPHCGHSDNEMRPGSDIQKKGVRITFKVKGVGDMNRQVVRQESAIFRIEELNFESAPFTSKGSLTTVEGLFQTAIEGLAQQQPVRKIMHPELADQIDEVIEKLTNYKSGDVPFTLIVEDISGNSFVENPFAPNEDPSMKVEHFTRTKEQNESLGMMESEEEKEEPFNLKDEVLEFPSNCMSCQSPISMKMKMVDIPNFKEVVIMASDCTTCGFKSNEVKAGGAIEPFGTKISFKMTDKTDLTRDVLTSETCSIKIPDLELELSYSSMSGRFTTVEGLLVNIREQLGKLNPFAFGDSSGKDTKFKDIISKLDKAIAGDLFITIVLDDSAGNSYVQNTYAPDSDPNLTIEKYKRSAEVDEELGISDMKTENYT